MYEPLFKRKIVTDQPDKQYLKVPWTDLVWSHGDFKNPLYSEDGKTYPNHIREGKCFIVHKYGVNKRHFLDFN